MCAFKMLPACVFVDWLIISYSKKMVSQSVTSPVRPGHCSYRLKDQNNRSLGFIPTLFTDNYALFCVM